MNDELYTDDYKKLSQKTQEAYERHHNRLMTITNGKTVLYFKDNITDLISLLKNQDIPPSSKNSILNVISLILKTKQKPIQSITDYRDELDKQYYINKKESNKLLKETLPTLAELNNFTEGLYSKKMYREYVINYLMIKFGVRNMDVDVEIVSDKSKVNDIDNFLLITKKYISFIVNRYKTRDTYGNKKMKIEVKPFISAVKHLYDECEDDVCYLLINPDTKQLVKDKNKFILNRTHKKLGEGLYFKIVVSNYISQGKISSAKLLGKTRGTDINTIIEDYYIE